MSAGAHDQAVRLLAVRLLAVRLLAVRLLARRQRRHQSRWLTTDGKSRREGGQGALSPGDDSAADTIGLAWGYRAVTWLELADATLRPFALRAWITNR